LRRSILACGLLLAFAGLATAAGAAARSGPAGASPGQSSGLAVARPGHARLRLRTVAYWSRHVRHLRAGTLHWLAVIRGRPPHGLRRRLSGLSLPRLRALARTWRIREHAAWRRANHPPGLKGWLCIHHYEGSWTDGGGPYWGGLQMDLSFQARYGGWLLRHKGTADRWSPLEQIWTAVRASRTRGYSPWASTAHYCGLV
jgi:hypothetical protein